MEELKKCDLEQCGYEEFLVWKCSYCGLSFCDKHKARHDHSCASTNIKIPSTEGSTDDTNTSSGSSFPSAQEIFRAVENRHDDLDLMTTGRVHANVKSSFLQKDEEYVATLEKVKRMETVMKSTKSEKQMSIAQKTKSLLLRSRAVGNDDIPQHERLYISVLFSLSATTKSMFLRNSISVGDALHHISESFTLLAYGSPVRPEAMTLAFNTQEPESTASGSSFVLCRWDNNSLLCQHLTEEFNELAVQPILITESILHQKEVSADQNLILKNMRNDEDSTAAFCVPVLKEENFVKGDRVIYRQNELAVIVAVHREDDPPFYTIQLCGDGGSIKEKQTDGVNLTLFKEPPTNTATSTAASANPPLKGGRDISVFSIRLSSGGKVRRVEGVPLNGTVSDLKRVVSMHTGVLPAKQKLLYKGKILKDDKMKLRNDSDPDSSSPKTASGSMKKNKLISVEDNGMVMMMTLSN